MNTALAQPAPKTTPRPPAGQARGSRVKVERGSVILLANQMAVMIDTGVPLGSALRGIADRSTDPKLGPLLHTVVQDVESGHSFSEALASHPRAFPPIMIALLRASEASGTMGTMLNRIAAYLTKEHLILKQVRGALMYPAFMFLICVSITGFLLTFVLPRFASIYAGKSAALPPTTQLLMDVSGSLVQDWYFWLGGAVALVVGFILWRKTPLGRVQFDWLKLNAPVASNLFGKLYLSRSCRTLGTLLETGVPMLDTIRIVRDITPNAYYDRLWKQVEKNLRNGQPLSDAMYESPVFPDSVTQMVESGEESGRLGEVCSRIADFAEAEFDQAVKTTTQFIEPVMIVVMGTVIGFIAIALLMPIFGVGKVVAGG